MGLVLSMGIFKKCSTMKKSKISVIICTYNGQSTLEECIKAILQQDYKNFEILFIDGGSEDKTKDIISKYSQRYKNFKLIINPNQIPEGVGNGKWLGFKKASGEFVAMIDQDNVLQRKDFFSLATENLKREKVVGVAGGLSSTKQDSFIVRYVSLFGTDSFLAYRSLDFIKNLKSEWGDYSEFPIKEDNMLLTGGNCFVYRSKDLRRIGGYSQDVLVLKKLLNKDSVIGLINNSTKHYAESSIFKLVKKKFKWGEKYFNNPKRFDYFPKTKSEYFYFMRNLFFNILIIPNLYYSFYLYRKKKDWASFLFPLIAFANTIAYGLKLLKSKFSKKSHRLQVRAVPGLYLENRLLLV